VATEAFFERSKEMYARHPELYAVMSEYYGQDPAAREARAEADALAESPAARKPAHRGSRVAAKVPAHAAAVAEWPAWVRFWDIHPGVSREQALRPLDKHVTFAAGWLLLTPLFFALSYANKWMLNVGMFLAPLLALTTAVLAVWLRLAVRWVDRHGGWGGDRRAPEPPADEAPEELPAPMG
jgi:hypothetical protein